MLTFQAYTIWMQRQNSQSIKDVKGDVKDVVRQTNHIKDQLVESTDKAAFSRGVIETNAANRAVESGRADRLNPFDSKMGIGPSGPAGDTTRPA
jgi:hypothetical protein